MLVGPRIARTGASERARHDHECGSAARGTQGVVIIECGPRPSPGRLLFSQPIRAVLTLIGPSTARVDANRTFADVRPAADPCPPTPAFAADSGVESRRRAGLAVQRRRLGLDPARRGPAARRTAPVAGAGDCAACQWARTGMVMAPTDAAEPIDFVAQADAERDARSAQAGCGAASDRTAADHRAGRRRALLVAARGRRVPGSRGPISRRSGD